MEINTVDCSANEVYRWMTGLITPRPIAWVSTKSRSGKANLAPYSFFNGVGGNPPCLMFCPANQSDGKPKDSLANIQETGQFAVNLVTEDVADAMNLTAGTYEPDIDEFELASLSKADCRGIDVPRVAQSLATFECTVMQVIQLGTGPGGANVVIGRIEYIHVDDSIVQEGQLNTSKLSTIGRLGGTEYVRTTDRFELSRPS